jgi:hypothetical protein
MSPLAFLGGPTTANLQGQTIFRRHYDQSSGRHLAGSCGFFGAGHGNTDNWGYLERFVDFLT